MTTTDKTLNEYHVFDGDPALGGEPWRDGPFYFASIDEAEEYVLVETMPAALRASHVAAGNAGVYPHNGARRVLMPRADAEELVEADGGWSRIVRAARDEDDGAYDVIFDVSVFTP